MLELQAVNANYGSFQALFDIDLSVEQGEAVAVIGPNGAGKTTLLRVISGLIPAGAGTMTMEGKSLKTVSPHSIIDLGIAHVPENRRLFPRMTVEDNLKMGGFIPTARKQFRERLEFVYELFPILAERCAQLAGTLSGGEQQMCAIARALMSNPKMLLMDEPSAGLAVPWRRCRGGRNPHRTVASLAEDVLTPPGKGGPALCESAQRPRVRSDDPPR